MGKRVCKKLTDRQIISLFKYHHPKNFREIKALGIKVKYFDKGVDRRAYRLGEGLILKWEDADSSSFDQTPHEIEIFQKIQKDEKYKSIRKHIPKLYYADKVNRLMIVAFCSGSEVGNEDDPEYVSLSTHIEKLIPECGNDLHCGNFRYAKNGLLMCIDLGYNI